MFLRMRALMAVVMSLVMLLGMPAAPTVAPVMGAVKRAPAKKKAVPARKKKPVHHTSVKGRVLDHKGHPVAGAKFWVGHPTAHHAVKHHTTQVHARVHHAARKHRTRAVHHVRHCNTHVMHVRTHRIVHAGPRRVRLAANGHLHVLTVAGHRRHHHRRHHHHRGYVMTDRFGRFILRGVALGTHAVHAAKHHGGKAATTIINIGANSNVTIVLNANKVVNKHVRRGGNLHVTAR